MSKPEQFVFSKRNYYLILVSLLLILAGFACMTGKGNHDASGFYEGIYSFRRITLAPLLLLSGYGLIIYAIMADNRKPKNLENGR
jgi:hypothetical protein